jgi:hypothetical protein
MWRNPKSWKWKWLSLQVIAPLGIPILVSALAAFVWEIGQPAFHMDMKVIADVTPWALVFFTMALLGGGFYDMWADWSTRPALSVSLLLVAFVVLIYASFIVIWRHSPAFVPGTGVYILALILLAATVVVCHEAAKV